MKEHIHIIIYDFAEVKGRIASFSSLTDTSALLHRKTPFGAVLRYYYKVKDLF